MDIRIFLKQPLQERLEALSRERQCSTAQLLEEALVRYLDLEEHCDDMFKTYGKFLNGQGKTTSKAA